MWLEVFFFFFFFCPSFLLASVYSISLYFCITPPPQFLPMAQRALHSMVSVSADSGWFHLCGGPDGKIMYISETASVHLGLSQVGEWSTPPAFQYLQPGLEVVEWGFPKRSMCFRTENISVGRRSGSSPSSNCPLAFTPSPLAAFSSSYSLNQRLWRWLHIYVMMSFQIARSCYYYYCYCYYNYYCYSFLSQIRKLEA